MPSSYVCPSCQAPFGSSRCFTVPVRLCAQVQGSLCPARTTVTASRGPTPYGKLGRTYVYHRNLLVGLDQLSVDKHLGPHDGGIPPRNVPNLHLRECRVSSKCRTPNLHPSKLALLNYTVDAYLPVAASALAASTVVRSLFGAAFPVSTSIAPGSV